MKQSRVTGFTFVELMIVVLLLGIFALLGLPALESALGRARLSGAAEEVVNGLEFAQSTSMNTGLETRVVIEAPQDRITVSRFHINADLYDGGDELVAADVENGTFDLAGYPMNKGTDYKVAFGVDSRFSGVDISASDFGSANPVTFDALGAPSKGGSVTLAFGGRQMVVTLDGLSGKVAVTP